MLSRDLPCFLAEQILEPHPGEVWQQGVKPSLPFRTCAIGKTAFVLSQCLLRCRLKWSFTFFLTFLLRAVWVQGADGVGRMSVSRK